MAVTLAEDGVEAGDISTLTIVPEGRSVTADLVVRESGVLAGMALLARAAALDPMNGRLHIDVLVKDGEAVDAGAVIGRVSGRWRDVLTCERTVLNLLSGSAAYGRPDRRRVHAVSSEVKVCDSRKTTPGFDSWRNTRCDAGWISASDRLDDAAYRTTIWPRFPGPTARGADRCDHRRPPRAGASFRLH